MKYTYAYKTSDGRRHEAAMEAASREKVFEALRAEGIRPIKVVAADGSKANGAERGGRRAMARWAAAVLAAAALAGVALWRPEGGEAQALRGGGAEARSFLDAGTRRQVVGDAAVIEKGIRTGWAEVFTGEGERFLASFAIPGVKAGQRSTSEANILRALETKAEVLPEDSIETRQIKAMVEGMKDEARRYIAAGGTAVGYGQRLVERQDAEIAIYGRLKAEVEAAHREMDAAAFEAYLEKRNDELRNLGIKPIVIDE